MPKLQKHFSDKLDLSDYLSHIQILEVQSVVLLNCGASVDLQKHLEQAARTKDTLGDLGKIVCFFAFLLIHRDWALLENIVLINHGSRFSTLLRQFPTFRQKWCTSFCFFNYRKRRTFPILWFPEPLLYCPHAPMSPLGRRPCEVLCHWCASTSRVNWFAREVSDCTKQRKTRAPNTCSQHP